MNNEKEKVLDEWLVLNCQQGDKKSLELLVERWQVKLMAYAISHLGDRDAAMEVTQNSLISIIKGIRNLKDPVSYPKWAYQILIRRINDWLRKEIRWRNTHQTGEQDVISNTKSGSIQVNGVPNFLQALDPEISNLVRLFYLEGFSIKEISELLDIPVGTVKSRLYYARKKLTTLIEDNSHE